MRHWGVDEFKSEYLRKNLHKIKIPLKYIPGMGLGEAVLMQKLSKNSLETIPLKLPVQKNV